MPLKFGSSAEAIIAVDDRGTVISWNDAATKLLGRSAAETMGRPCHEVMQGITPSGRHLCGPGCPVQASCRELRAPRRFEMIVRHPDGNELWLEATTCVVIDEDDRPVAIHILAESVSARRLAELAESVVRRVSRGEPEAIVAADSRVATRRELDVLGLLAEGLSTAQIASRLGLSRATVRNHVQNLLLKLDAHSRAEAVVLAVKSGLVHLH
jgi:PAS domain S-box-containing protein